MLKSLYIKNYAIIDELNIDFNSGFNVFTGETGAGKSIIVGALSFLIRGKADTSIIRSGFDKAIIEGVFDVDEYMKKTLDEAEIDYDDEIIVRRIISKDNHNSIKINQFSVTLSFLTELFSEHIDIHSQQDSQYLFNKKNHQILLDRYINEDKLLSNMHDAYDKYHDAYQELEDLKNNTYNERDLEYIKFDLNEIEQANLNIDEEIELENKEKRYKSQEKYITVLGNSISMFDEEGGIQERLSSLYKNINLDDQVIEDIRNNIENIYYSLNDEMDKLKDIYESFNDEDTDINYIEERLYTYSKLKRKHNLSTEELINKKDELKDKISFFENKDYVLNEKQKKVDDLYNKAFDIASKLSEIRKKKAKKLESLIEEQCNDLMLNNTKFSIQINEYKLNRNGIDDIEFFISLNKGEQLKPLRNVASGGEISRLMLALKTIFTSLSDNSLVIFDEIDTGVSGKVSLAIGQKMASIAKNTQVITITHLAAVAACAKTHYYIYKQDDGAYTSTSIKKLSHDEIINELAMISSSDNSSEALKAAEQLYNSAQSSL